MIIRESIRIEGTPFPRPLPVSLEQLQQAFSGIGILFEDRGHTRSVKFSGLYEPTRLSGVQEVVDEQNWDVKVSRTMWPEFDDKDYHHAPLWKTYFPDLWMNDIDFSWTCTVCKRKRTKIDTNVRVTKVKSRKPFHYVNGQFMIVSAEAKSVITDLLVGASFHPFDEQEKYFYMESTCELGPLIIHDDEIIGHTGECPECKLPIFKTYFGPLRYTKSRWSGEDIVHESFHEGFLFTPKAFDLLRTFNRSLKRDGIALLE